MGDLIEIYPCNDHPAACGWDKKGPDGGKTYICAFPECWCKGWVVGRPRTNKTIEKGQLFSAILYRGKDQVLAEGIFKHFLYAREDKGIIPLDNVRLSLRIHNVELIQMGDTYQIDIRGELE